MGFFIKKKVEQIPQTTNKEVEGAEVWMVSWNSLRDSGYHNPNLTRPHRVAKAFLSEKDAYDFVESLKEAMNLLQCGFAINISVEKQI